MRAENRSRLVNGLVGMFILAIVVVGYMRTLMAGYWPSGHPWSGLALVSFGALFLAYTCHPPKGDSGQRNNKVRQATVVLAVVASLLWSISLFMD